MPTPRTPIVTVTLNPALDVWATTPHVQPERKLHCTDAELTPGGHHRIPASVFQSGRRSERADIKLVPAKR